MGHILHPQVLAPSNRHHKAAEQGPRHSQRRLLLFYGTASVRDCRRLTPNLRQGTYATPPHPRNTSCHTLSLTLHHCWLLQCKDVALACHDEILKVLNELQFVSYRLGAALFCCRCLTPWQAVIAWRFVLISVSMISGDETVSCVQRPGETSRG